MVVDGLREADSKHGDSELHVRLKFESADVYVSTVQDRAGCKGVCLKVRIIRNSVLSTKNVLPNPPIASARNPLDTVQEAAENADCDDCLSRGHQNSFYLFYFFFPTTKLYFSLISFSR